MMTIAISAGLAGCNPAGTSLESDVDKRMRTALVGKWYAAVENDLSTEHHLLELAADGTQVVRQKVWHPDGTVTEHVGRGRWYVTDGVFKLKYDVWDSQTVAAYDGYAPYRIVSVDEVKFLYRDEIRFRPVDYAASRVPDGFTLADVRTSAGASLRK